MIVFVAHDACDFVEYGFKQPYHAQKITETEGALFP
jgi:hypothetical protein